MTRLIAKKCLGQHFLRDKNIAHKIVSALSKEPRTIVEVGPGTGILTELLVQQKDLDLYLVEVDPDLVSYLKQTYPTLRNRIIAADFLKLALTRLHHGPVAIIGNFPYNISSQIFFKVLEHRQQVYEVVGMIQKEVAERLASPPGNKTYGILSVLLQTWYHIEYLFSVSPGSFFPRPDVQSAVIRLTRNDRKELGVDQKKFKTVVKMAFNQRRKMLRNSVKGLLSGSVMENPLFQRRPEQLSVDEFIVLTKFISDRKEGFKN